MASISIIGSGSMGQAIKSVFDKGGHGVEFVGRDASQPVNGQIVVLAVPYPAVAEILAERAGQLAGKVVVDITNPVDFATFDSLVVPADSSAAALIQAQLPSRRSSRPSTRTSVPPCRSAGSESWPPRCSSPVTTRPPRLPCSTPCVRAA